MLPSLHPAANIIPSGLNFKSVMAWLQYFQVEVAFKDTLSASTNPIDPSTIPTAKISPLGLYAKDCTDCGSVRAFICSLLLILHIRRVLSDPDVANCHKTIIELK